MQQQLAPMHMAVNAPSYMVDQESSNNERSNSPEHNKHGVIINDDDNVEGYYSQSIQTANELATSAQPTVQQ